MYVYKTIDAFTKYDENIHPINRLSHVLNTQYIV